MLRPLVGEPFIVNRSSRLPTLLIVPSRSDMDDGGLSAALTRAEQALARIEQSLANRQQSQGRDEELRAKVRDAVAELDQLIRESAHG